MSQYHINPDTGRPNICKAQTPEKCLYSVEGNSPKHYKTKDDARKDYEKQNSNQIIKSIKKDKQLATFIKATPEEIENKFNEDFMALEKEFAEILQKEKQESIKPQPKKSASTVLSLELETKRDDSKVYFKNGQIFNLTVHNQKDFEDLEKASKLMDKYYNYVYLDKKDKEFVSSQFKKFFNDDSYYQLSSILNKQNPTYLDSLTWVRGSNLVSSLMNDIHNNYELGATREVYKNVKNSNSKFPRKEKINIKILAKVNAEEILRKSSSEKALEDFYFKKKQYASKTEDKLIKYYDKELVKNLKNSKE